MRGRARALGAAAALAAACSGGLDTQYGNPFPCNFTDDAGVRDLACPSGWVCGPSGTCEPFVDEGLPTDPVPTVPDFGGAARQMPALLVDAVRYAAPDPLVTGDWFVGDTHGAFYLVTPQGVTSWNVVGPTGTAPTGILGLSLLNGRVFVHGDAGAGAAYVWTGPVDSPLNALVDTATGMLDDMGPVRVAARPGIHLIDGGIGVSTAAFVERLSDSLPGRADARQAQVSFTSFDVLQPDGGILFDAGSTLSFQDLRLPSRQRLDPLPSGQLFGCDPLGPVTITQDGFYLFPRQALLPNGTCDTSPRQWRRLNTEDFGFPANVSLQARHSADGEVWAVSLLTGVQRANVLSTWIAQPAASGTVMSRLWDDCTPCPPGSLLRLTSPQSQPAPGVEVLCASPSSGLTLWSVVGSQVTSSDGRCTVQELTPSFDPYEVSQYNVGTLPDGGAGVGTLVTDFSVGDQVALGGAHGQLWRGAAFSAMAPVFLDRVPLGAGAQGGALMALTPSFHAVQTDAGMSASSLNVATGGQVDTTVALAAAAQGGDGWFILNTADIAFFDGVSLGFGPRLLDPAGAASPGPFLAQANRTQDTLVATANDSVYAYPVDVTRLTQASGQLDGLIPQLTPQPNFPIRSMVLDQTLSPEVSSATGQVLVGYLLTSSTVFRFGLAGQPLQWFATPLTAGHSEPVKVWMQSASSPNGRVGYRDGSVYTLPHGFPFVGPLPAIDGGPNRALAFETLDNYPVVLAQDGLYVAVPPPGFSGGYAQLSWQPVARGVPGLDPPFSSGLLYSLNQGSASTLYLFGQWGRVFRLATAANQ